MVYAAHDADDPASEVAIKLLARRLGEDRDRRARFLREAAILRTVRAPGIVPLIDSGEHDGRLFLVLERVRGASLERALVTEAAAQASQAGQQSSAALGEAAKATAQAAASSLESAQSAARGNLANSKQANAQTSKSLAAAGQALAQQQSRLRNQAGLPMSAAASSSGPASGKANGEPPAGDGTGHSGEPQKGFSAADRQAMSDLRQTPVPPEYSGTVRSYFEQLAAE